MRSILISEIVSTWLGVMCGMKEGKFTELIKLIIYLISTWLGVMCGMKDGTGWGATRALFAALEVDWPRVGGTFANLEIKFNEDKKNEPKEAHPFPGLRTGFVAAVCKITLGVEEWEPEKWLINIDLFLSIFNLFQTAWAEWCREQQQPPSCRSWSRTWTTSPSSPWSSGWPRELMLLLVG